MAVLSPLVSSFEVRARPRARRRRTVSTPMRVPGLSALVVGGLLGFHLWILWGRVRAGALAEPAVAGRWLGALALVVLAVRWRRHGLTLFGGRRGLVLWLLVLLLHSVGPAMPAAPISAASLGGSATLVGGFHVGVWMGLLAWMAATSVCGAARSSTLRTGHRCPGDGGLRLLAGYGTAARPRGPPRSAPSVAGPTCPASSYHY